MDRMELCTAPPSPQSGYQQQPLPYPAGALGAQLGQQGLRFDSAASWGRLAGLLRPSGIGWSKPLSIRHSSAARYTRPVAGSNLARPTAGAGGGAIITSNTTNPNVSSAANCAKMLAAVCRPNISNRPLRWSNKR